MSCTTTDTIQKGDVVTCEGDFDEPDGDAVDPSNVFFQFRDPSGNLDSYQFGVDAELKTSGTGRYYVDVDADESGIWYYRFYSTGIQQGANEGSFEVEQSQF